MAFVGDPPPPPQPPPPAPISPAPPPSPQQPADMRRGPKPETKDQESLEGCLKRQRPQAAAAIAARAALRAAPGVVRSARKRRNSKDASVFLTLTSAVFRAGALSRVAVKYPHRANELGAAALVAAARAASADAAAVADVHALVATASALAAAAVAADAAALDSPFAAPFAEPAPFVAAYAAADPDLRMEIRFDASAPQGLGAGGLADLPLWSQGRPDWAVSAWENMKTELPRDEGWDVWIDWYADRLRGGSGGEAYELVFVSAPLEVWERGPAAAHAWIREHLKDPGRLTRLTLALPEPV